MTDDTLEPLLVEVRAGTNGFAADMARMRSALDTTLVDGFAGAGAVLERGLLAALKKGSIGFEDLGRMALQIIDRIASHAIQAGLDTLLGGLGGGGKGSGDGGGIGGLLAGGFGALLGLPGRATGGPVAPGRGYLVGERGPELFVPTSAGRVEVAAPSRRSDVRVAINLAAPRGTTTPTALARSSRQVASAVRRALMEH
ncbi:MAG: tail tape measure protein [Citromicrobium sp.]|nr:MAG: tail tape measure protein [Citromicrobium sp.]